MHVIAGYRSRLTGAVILGLAIVLVLLSITLLSGDTPAVGRVCLGVAEPFALVGVYASLVRIERITVLDRGLTHRRGRRIDAYPWEGIEAVWSTRRRRAGSTAYELEREDGKRLKIGRRVPNGEQQMASVLRGTGDAKVETALRDYRSGRRLPFGSIRLEGDTLTCGQRTFAIEEVASAEVHATGRITVQGR
jgi:hypothetical protein